MRYVELPDRIQYGGRWYRVLPEREYLTLKMTLDSNGAAEASIRNPLDKHILADYWTGYCSNTAGLAAFRVAIADQKDNTPQILKPEKDTDAVAPRASLVMTDASGLAEARPLLKVFPVNVLHKVKITDGTGSDVVEVTFHVREMELED